MAGAKSHGIPWRSSPKLWIPGPSSEGNPGTSSHTYPGEMKMNDEKTVSNENVFQTRFLVCCHVGYGILMLFCSHCPMMAQRWKAEKPCLSMKLHLAEGKQQDMVMNDYTASLPIEGKLRVFHALVWMA